MGWDLGRAHLGGAQATVYAGPRGLVPFEAAFALARWVASANRHVSTALVGSRFESTLLVDIGRDISDIVAVRAGRPCAQGWSDRERIGSACAAASAIALLPPAELDDGTA